MDGRTQAQVNLRKTSLAVALIYALLVLGFYFLAGDQLRYRESRGNLAAPAAESGIVELVQGTIVEQSFIMKIQRLERLSVQWGTYYRPNAGAAVMELWNQASGQLLLQQSFDVAAISEGGFTTLTAAEPLEGLYNTPLLLRIYADSQLGSAVSPLMSLSAEKQEGFALFLNGENMNGTLCFSASGSDYIWTGLHYWTFASVGLAAVLVFFIVVGWRQKKGHSYVVNALIAVQKYHFLINQLVGRDFKTKYKRSMLGVFWSFLNPLLTMVVQYMVFSTVFKSNISNFPAYLLIGIVSFNFFSEACGMALTSILGNASLIKKVYMPKYIYPLTRVISSVVNLLISLIPMVLVCVITGIRFHKSAILALFFLGCVVIFTLGLGLLLSSAMVFFRDTQFLWGVMAMIWMYVTPIFYPENILPDNLKFIHQINPLYHFIQAERMCILDGLSPEPIVYAQCMLMALAMLMVGAIIFHKSQDKFVLYL